MPFCRQFQFAPRAARRTHNALAHSYGAHSQHGVGRARNTLGYQFPRPRRRPGRSVELGPNRRPDSQDRQGAALLRRPARQRSRSREMARRTGGEGGAGKARETPLAGVKLSDAICGDAPDRPDSPSAPHGRIPAADGEERPLPAAAPSTGEPCRLIHATPAPAQHRSLEKLQRPRSPTTLRAEKETPRAAIRKPH
jgi:hypothetical protein